MGFLSEYRLPFFLEGVPSFYIIGQLYNRQFFFNKGPTKRGFFINISLTKDLDRLEKR